MGTGLTVHCDCGFEAKTAVGGARSNYRTTCPFPCLCKGCRNLVTANLLAKPPACPDCGSTDIVPYDQPELIGTRGTATVASCSMQYELGRNLVLTDGLYCCPKCESMSLRFVAYMRFD